MSQQQQGAEQAPDLNNELQTRREKLSALRDNGNAFPMISAEMPCLTNYIKI